MKRDHAPFSPSRRRVLGLGAGLAAAAWTAGRLAPADAAADAEPLLARAIPHGGERLPVIGLGTTIVFDVDDDAAKRKACAEVVKTLAAGGGKLIDTAPSYGSAEGVVGDILAETGLRPRMFVATKLEGYDRASGPGDLKGSLQRLRTRSVDLMQLHNVRDPGQDLAMLREWKAQGFCRYYGITTSFDGAFPAMEAVLRRQKPDFVQINYSLGDREAEKRVLPAAAEVGAAVLTDLPFGRNRLFRAVRGKSVPEWAQPFAGTSWAVFFLKYLIANPAVTAVIPGTSNPAHMADNLGAGRGRLPDAAERRKMVEFIEALG